MSAHYDTLNAILSDPTTVVTTTSGNGGNTPTFANAVGLASYAKASLPTGSTGQVIYVSDATGAHVTGSVAFYNGTHWIDVTTGTTVA